MHEFFIPKDSVKGNIAKIEKEDFHHLIHVLRAKIGDKVIIVINRGEKYISKIVDIKEKDRIVKLEIEEKINESFEPKVNIYLAQSIVKGKKFEEILKTGTELGVKYFYPLITERTEVNLKIEKIERFKKLVKEEAQVSKRNIIPEVYKPIKFEEFLNLDINTKNKFIFWELENKNSIYDIDLKDNEDIVLIVGNEGGFSIKEVNMARDKGFISLTLGKRILRAEVAPVVILSIFLYKLFEFKK
ncbi:MAG: 16S rRNA (uracil(1498)-N(3))-methyltransferase [Caldisericia bacterium]|nr:16S rRNA (uracil(1498)-N(3))-methyltransferase [Caldisericia bacterium]